MRIWKWNLITVDRQTLDMPFGAEVLTVQNQAGMLRLWAICDEDESRKEQRVFAVYGTGNPLPVKPGEYLGTVQDGPFVWHVFEAFD